eukprot:761548-Hanusia_phi.AAC.1
MAKRRRRGARECDVGQVEQVAAGADDEEGNTSPSKGVHRPVLALWLVVGSSSDAVEVPLDRHLVIASTSMSHLVALACRQGRVRVPELASSHAPLVCRGVVLLDADPVVEEPSDVC